MDQDQEKGDMEKDRQRVEGESYSLSRGLEVLRGQIIQVRVKM